MLTGDEKKQVFQSVSKFEEVGPTFVWGVGLEMFITSSEMKRKLFRVRLDVWRGQNHNHLIPTTVTFLELF